MANITSIYANRSGRSWGPIQDAIKTANGLQTFFAFQLKECDFLPDNGDMVDFEGLARSIGGLEPKVAGLLLSEGKFDNGRLVNELLPDRIYVSCDVPKGLKVPPFRLYLLYQMASAALTLMAGVSAEVNDEMLHRHPVGCLWDWWSDSSQRNLAMLSARICRDCRHALSTHGTSSEAMFTACQQILDYIRRSLMGESPEVANRVFIAYGYGEDWKTLSGMLQGWGLEIEHFNMESTVGVAVTERWRQMLNRARFAFAVMTPDEELKNGKKRARQNVIHEIGLCHARLGVQSTAICLAKGTEKFSNVDGITFIPFVAGKLGAQKEEIRKLLEERGIL